MPYDRQPCAKSGRCVVLVARQKFRVQPPPLASGAIPAGPVHRSPCLPQKMQWLNDMERLTANERLVATRMRFPTLQQYPSESLYRSAHAPHLLYNYQFCLKRAGTVLFMGRAGINALEDLPMLFEELSGPARPSPKVSPNNLQHTENFCT